MGQAQSLRECELESEPSVARSRSRPRAPTRARDGPQFGRIKRGQPGRVPVVGGGDSEGLFSEGGHECERRSASGSGHNKASSPSYQQCTVCNGCNSSDCINTPSAGRPREPQPDASSREPRTTGGAHHTRQGANPSSQSQVAALARQLEDRRPASHERKRPEQPPHDCHLGASYNGSHLASLAASSPATASSTSAAGGAHSADAERPPLPTKTATKGRKREGDSDSGVSENYNQQPLKLPSSDLIRERWQQDSLLVAPGERGVKGQSRRRDESRATRAQAGTEAKKSRQRLAMSRSSAAPKLGLGGADVAANCGHLHDDDDDDDEPSSSPDAASASSSIGWSCPSKRRPSVDRVPDPYARPAVAPARRLPNITDSDCDCDCDDADNGDAATIIVGGAGQVDLRALRHMPSLAERIHSAGRAARDAANTERRPSPAELARARKPAHGATSNNRPAPGSSPPASTPTSTSLSGDSAAAPPAEWRRPGDSQAAVSHVRAGASGGVQPRLLGLAPAKQQAMLLLSAPPLTPPPPPGLPVVIESAYDHHDHDDEFLDAAAASAGERKPAGPPHCAHNPSSDLMVASADSELPVGHGRQSRAGGDELVARRNANQRKRKPFITANSNEARAHNEDNLRRVARHPGSVTELIELGPGQANQSSFALAADQFSLPSYRDQHPDSAQTQQQPQPPDDWRHLDWREISQRYRKMPREHRGEVLLKWRESCFCRLLLGSLHSLFPIFSSFRDYKLPGDFITDIVAGCTIAVLHVPQGMAYGLLAGVEPIHGLYVSFIPVIIMALMSKSRHVSYGTFAIISMLLANSTNSFKALLKSQEIHLKGPKAAEVLLEVEEAASGVVVTNNHQAHPLNSLARNSTIHHSQALRHLAEMPIADDDDFSENKTAIHYLAPDPGFLSPESFTDFVMPSNIEILTTICLLVGLCQVAMSVMRLGILSLMFSDQLVSSFTNASALHVITSQLGALFDVTVPNVSNGMFKICRVWWAFGAKMLEGVNKYTLTSTISSIFFLLFIKEVIEPILSRRFKRLICLPSELILMAFMIFMSWYWQFNNEFDMRIVGNIPTDLPTFQVPKLSYAPLLFQDALTIALVSFAMNLSLAQVYARRYNYKMDANQELFALGSANFISSFFSCFPCASSLSRSAVQSNLNAKSQLCSLISCAIVVSITCYFAPILHDLPRSTLSCIIVVALKGILGQFKDLFENWRLSKLDALVWIATFMSVIAFDVTYGLVLGIVASLFMVFFRLLTPNHSILGQLPGTDVYVDRNAFVDSREISRVRIFRFNSPLCYLNRTMFKSSVEKSLASALPSRNFGLISGDKSFSGENHDEKIKFLIIDCSALAYCDYSGAMTLVDLIEEMAERDLTVYLAACPLKLVAMIDRMQKTKVLETNVFPSIAEAINYSRYRKDTAHDITIA